ncbi:hypothetical protein MASR2M78_26720 [Treponema sp.]
MTMKEIENELRKRFSSDDEEALALERFLLASKAPASFADIEEELPKKARYVGPGPWIDAIKNSFENI